MWLCCSHSRGKGAYTEAGQGCRCQAGAWIWVAFLTPDVLCGFWLRQPVGSWGAPCSQGTGGSEGSLNSHAGTWCLQRIWLSVPQEAVDVFLVLFHMEIKWASLFSATGVVLDCPWVCLALLTKGSYSSDEAYYTAARFLCSLYKPQPGVLSLIINYKTQWLNAARFIII